MPTDQRNILDDAIFAYRTNKAGNVFISWNGKQVTILQDAAARKFLATIAGLEGKAAQLVMAKITGNFKRGNERNAKK